MRSISGPDAPTLPEPDVDEVVLSVEGGDWVARVLGRSGRARTGVTPLLLIGFWPADSTSPDPVREAFVVGATLASVTADALEAAWSRSREKPPGLDDPPGRADPDGRR